MVKIRVKVVKIGNSIRVTIPKEILRETTIKVGDVLLVDYDSESHKITLEKA